MAVEYGIKFMETSAKASISVEEAFFMMARDIKSKMEKKLVSIACVVKCLPLSARNAICSKSSTC